MLMLSKAGFAGQEEQRLRFSDAVSRGEPENSQHSPVDRMQTSACFILVRVTIAEIRLTA